MTKQPTILPALLNHDWETLFCLWAFDRNPNPNL